jgi:magnesium transporter
VRLLIVPAATVSDAVAETAVRLRTSEIHVGESETLPAADQARLLGAAWERVPRPEPLDVRLVIHHSSGGSAVYQLGAHTPTLNADDLNLIHAIWLDVVKTVGPHVHHRDVVRAALTHMQEQLNTEGPGRDAALELIRHTAHPADELAAVVRQRDFARLRDMVRNRSESELAAVFAGLSLEDQVVTFRVLPRKVAAATFEYLSHDAQQTLLKGMAQEDVAAILNDMAPDDRTMFLEELPAAVTQQLLTLLTPDERAVAATLLGYPEHSIGRLMTPDYIAVREHWTVQDVLDYIRAHGQDSETLNVIYVVDDQGALIDDIRIREFLLTSPSGRVSELMDRRFVALSALDAQDAAVTVFRREDRPALPVTDSAGVLIGIVTIDDVLDVAEAAATKEMQQVGGSEALDEPYMQIAFTKMIRKRAGWLTALFLGEMLTATAMGAFEHEIARAVVLALFVPLIISSGGNSGSQASTLVIRAIALGEVALSDWWRVMRREIAAGLALGGILGTIGFLRISIWSAFSTLYGPHWLLVAITVGVSLVGVVLWGTLTGSLLPFALRRLGFDPAASSAPFVATLVDVTGLVIYFSVGIVILRGTLL